MRVCYFYTKIREKAVAALPDSAEFVYVGESNTSYWEAICERWGTDDLMFVEHDNVIGDSAVRQFEECPEPWCVFPYWNNAIWLHYSLGCTRFRKEVMIDPADIQQESDCREHVEGCWIHIDKKIRFSLEKRGFKPCLHYPFVEHIGVTIPEWALVYESNMRGVLNGLREKQ